MPGLIEENLAAYWLALASLAGGEVHHESDVVWAYTGLPVLNRVVATRLDDASADARIGEVLSEFERRRASVAWLVGPDARPATLRERLTARGLEHVETLVGMELDLEHAPGSEASLPGGLDVREVVDETTRAAWLDVIRAAFRLPEPAIGVLRRVSERMAEQTTTALTVPTSAPGTDGPWRSFVGYQDGKPVTTATLVPAAGVAGVYLVGTLPKQERHGLGTALTLHVLRAARDSGHQRAVLQSTEAGEPMYAAIGFEARCRIGVYRRSQSGGLVRSALGRVRRIGERAAAMFGPALVQGALGLGLIGCALLEAPGTPAQPQPGQPAATAAPTAPPRPTAVPPTPTPDPRGALLERRPPVTFQPNQINQIMARFYPAGTSMPARFAVDQHFIRYVSTEPSGERIEILAQLFVPRVEAATQMTVVVYGAGTTGLGDQCAPSLEQPTVRNWGDYQAHMLSYGGQGYITIIADYAGFNDTARLQRYFIAQSEARVLLDATRATYKFFQEAAPGSLGTGAQPSKNVFYAGYSQGGHAAFAVRDEYTRYAPDVPVTGVIGHGGSMDLTALLRDSPSFAPMVLYSLADHYGPSGPTGVDVGKLLATRWLPSLTVDMTTKCIDQMAGYYTNNHATVYQPAFNAALMGNRLEAEYPSVKEALDRNSTGQAASEIPALVVQGGGDPIVSQRSQDAFVARLCAAGQHVNYVLYPGVHHFQTRQVGFRDTINWIEAVARGAPPRSTCPGR